MSSQAPSPLAEPIAWDLVADGYATDIAPHLTRYSEDALALAEVSPGARVVDVACGPGTLSLAAARRGARVSAIDFSSEMIAQLNARAARDGVGAIEATVGDGMALPFGDASFDAGFSMFGLMFFPDRDKGLRELRRVLRRDGRAVIATWVPMDRVPLLAEVFDGIREWIPGLPLGGDTAPLSDADSCRVELTRAGFRSVSVREVTHSMEAPSMGELWASFERSNAPVVLLRKRLGEHEWARVAASVRERLVARFGEGAQRIEMTALLSTAH